MTVTSRVFGFMRDMVVASLFGADFVADAFFVAFRISNLFALWVGGLRWQHMRAFHPSV